MGQRTKSIQNIIEKVANISLFFAFLEDCLNKMSDVGDSQLFLACEPKILQELELSSPYGFCDELTLFF